MNAIKRKNVSSILFFLDTGTMPKKLYISLFLINYLFFLIGGHNLCRDTITNINCALP